MTPLSNTPSKIRKLAETNSLEVEHIIEAAFSRDENIAKELESLSENLNWPEDNRVGDDLVVPLAKWSRFACVFIGSGYEGLVDSYETENDFSLAFLSEYKTPESISAVLQIGKRLGKEASLKSKNDIASSINSILSFDDKPNVAATELAEARELLHSYFIPDLDQPMQATIYCALRGVGNQESIDLISSQKKLIGAWIGTETAVIKAIKKSMRENA